MLLDEKADQWNCVEVLRDPNTNKELVYGKGAYHISGQKMGYSINDIRTTE